MKRGLLAIFLMCTSSGFAQPMTVDLRYIDDPASQSISYHVHHQLTWNDFNDQPDESSTASALTTAGFGYSFRFSSNGVKSTLSILVHCSFLKSKSWVKPEKNTDYILTHEQHHFDIPYICTMKFMQMIRLEKLTPENYQGVVTRIYTDCFNEMNRLQDEYDSQTQHSIIPEQQASWNKKIGKMLEEWVHSD